MTVKALKTAVFAATALWAGHTNAAPQSVQTLEYVETPARSQQPEDAALAPTTVLRRDDIERLQARSVTELLERAPGVSIARSGGPANQTSVFLRGTDADHVLVLVDGVRLASATAGLTAFQDIPVEQIERLEIVRGPRSSLYGADALGGVIQIFTRRGGGPTRPHFAVGGGRYDSFHAQAGLQGGGERSRYSVSATHRRANGYDICDNNALTGGCFTAEPDDDGFERQSLSAQAGHEFRNGLTLAAHALYSDGDSEFDGSFTNETDTVQQVYGASVEARPLSRWRLRLEAGQSRDESDNFNNGSFVSRFDTEQDTAGLQNRFSLGESHELMLGADYRNEAITSTTDYNETERDNTGVYAQYLGRLGDHELELAARHDDDEQFGQHSTGSLTWGWRLARGYTITASYGTGFNAPAFNDLYFPGFANPDLDPEESTSSEIGLLHRQGENRWSLRVFETDIDDLIVLDGNFIGQNISQARIRGVEAEAATRRAGWRLGLNGSWLDAENRADDANRGNDLPRRPDYTLQFDADRPFGRHSLGASLRVEGSRYDEVANANKLDARVLIDLRTAWRFKPDWQLQARLSNLLDDEGESARFFNPPGRNLYLTLSYAPDPKP
ncbi:MAG: TonB-dependent vitamin B12 receptor [Salinisphaeraceae bacterium]|nr:TonB-dependent vitamin B12 receptor [Salinisphaeraceae bacterium]